MLQASNGRVGWDLFEMRSAGPDDRLDTVLPWDGHPCRVLVIMADWGFGDAIHFLRYVPLVARAAAEVFVAVHDELVATVASSPLLAGTEVISKSAAHARAWPADARWERLMSLPRHLPAMDQVAATAYVHQPVVPARLALSPADGVMGRLDTGPPSSFLRWPTGRCPLAGPAGPIRRRGAPGITAPARRRD
jgi:hypothetical protein